MHFYLELFKFSRADARIYQIFKDLGQTRLILTKINDFLVKILKIFGKFSALARRKTIVRHVFAIFLAIFWPYGP